MKCTSDVALEKIRVYGERGLPLHLQLRSALRQAIEEHFEDGQSFWTEAVLAERLTISRGTVRQALAELAREGLLERKAARGSVVRKGQAEKCLGVFVPQYDSDFFNGVLEQLGATCAERGVRMRVYHTYRSAGIQTLLQQVEGAPHEESVVFLGTGNATRDLYDALDERGYATVAIDTLLPRYTGRYVGTDNCLGMRLGLDHLWNLGHRAITLLVNEPGDVLSVRDRVQAFQDFMAQHNGEARIVECRTPLWNDSFEAALGHMNEVWQAPYPTAVFTVSDPGAWAALKWFSQQNIAVPDEVSVTGFEGVRQSRFTHPALTTVAHPMQDLARHALQMLENIEVSRDFLPPTLIIRESTAAPAASRDSLRIANKGTQRKRAKSQLALTK